MGTVIQIINGCIIVFVVMFAIGWISDPANIQF